MARVTRLAGKEKKPGGRPKRGIAGAGSARRQEPFRNPAEPARVGGVRDLLPNDIYAALEADQAAPPWPLGGDRSAALRPPRVDIPLALARDIHCFMMRALGCRAPAIATSIPVAFKLTALGRDLAGLFAQIKAGVPRDYSHHSEHVRLFLDAYKHFGLDGGEGDPDALEGVNAAPDPQVHLHEYFLRYLRQRSRERIKPKEYPVTPDQKKHIEAARANPLRARYWEQRKKRRARAYKSNRAAAALIEDIFRREKSVYVVRLDLGVMPDLFEALKLSYVTDEKTIRANRELTGDALSKSMLSRPATPVEGFKQLLKSLFRSINKGIGPLHGIVGRFARLMWSPSRGLYCHLVLFYTKQSGGACKDLAQKVADYWVFSATKGVGVYAVPDEGSSIYIRSPVGSISETDLSKREELLYSASYLSAIDEYFSLPSDLVCSGDDVFFYSELQTIKPVVRPHEKRRPGRPKKGEHFDRKNS